MKIENNLELVHKNFYELGLLLSSDRKVITEIAEVLNVSHDKIQRDFNKSSQSIEKEKEELILQAQKTFKRKQVTIIVDDTAISKPYAHDIEGLDVVFDSNKKQCTVGMVAITVILTDGTTHLPVYANLHYSKKISKKNYVPKSLCILGLCKELMGKFNIKRVIADAHYTNAEVFKELKKLGINFLNKIPRNRIIEYRGKKEQVNQLCKLKKNQRTRRIRALFKGVICYIYAVKYDSDTINYYVSSEKIDRKKIAEIYKGRWVIEKFHRTAKQKLGLQQCQARSANKQLLHVLNVMKAYQNAELIRRKEGLKTVDSAIKYCRKLKSKILQLD